MTTPRSIFVPTTALRLHCVEWSRSGPALLFLHGGSAHAHWWDFVAPRFTDRFRVLVLDLRGHGASEWARDRAYRIEDYASDVAAVVRALDLERPVLVGHSLGSFVALRHAIDHPRGLAALVVVDGRATFGASGSRYMKLLKMLAPAEYSSLEEAVRRFRLLPDETSASAEVLEHVARSSFRRSDSGRWTAAFDRESLSGHEPFDFSRRLRDLELPVLFVRGERSRVLGRDAAAELAASCREGSWVEIEGAHHHVPLDRPEALAEAIRTFLDRVSGHGRLV